MMRCSEHYRNIVRLAEMTNPPEKSGYKVTDRITQQNWPEVILMRRS